MSLTGNYEAGFELTEEVVKDIFKGARESGELPHELTETGNIAGFDLEAIVKILQTNAAGDLDVSFITRVQNGIRMTLPLEVEMKEKKVDGSAAPSINPITFQAALEITAPVQALADSGGSKELVLNLAGLPDQQVAVGMPSSPVIPVAGEIHGVGSVETELDQIDVNHEVIILSGGSIQVDTSSLSQPLTASQSGSPYAGYAASLISLQSVFSEPNAKHSWDFGDGTSGEGKQVKHPYE
jgi:hypothetical protein